MRVLLLRHQRAAITFGVYDHQRCCWRTAPLARRARNGNSISPVGVALALLAWFCTLINSSMALFSGAA